MRTGLLILALMVGLATPAGAQLSPEGGDIDIEGDASELVPLGDGSRWAWEGDVRVSQGDVEIRADRIDFHLRGEEWPGELQRIVATGSVVYRNPTTTARGDHGVYTVADDTIRLTGRVRLVRGADVFCSHELILQPNLGTFRAVRGDASDDPLCLGRVRGMLHFEEAPGAEPPTN